MTYKEIEKKAYNFKGKKIWVFDDKRISENILEILKICINNDIKLDLTSDDVVKIINIYYDLYRSVNMDELKMIMKQANDEIDYVKLLNKMS